MSFAEIEFIGADNSVQIKEEVKSDLGDDDQDADFSTLNLDPSFVRNTKRKYGEIFMLDTSKLILICSICDELHTGMQQFGEHIRKTHLANVGGYKDFKHEVESIKTDEVEIDDIYKFENKVHEDSNGSEDDDDSYRPDSGSECELDAIVPKEERNAEADPKYFCGECNRQYKNARTFNRHYKAKHDITNVKKETKKPVNKNPKETDLKCRYCDKECISEHELSEHRKTHDRIRPYQCPHCPRTFQSNAQREVHIHMHLGTRPYQCDQCPSAFRAEIALRHHMLTHNVPGNYSCEICGKQFIQKCNKDVHMRSHTGEKPVQCELCGRKFIKQSRLTEHMKRHNNTRDHECDVCGKRFYTNVLLNHHKVAHSSERPFACEVCGKTFSRKISLKKHRSVHSDVKQFACNICDKSFRQYSGLYSHRKSHGQQNGLPQTNILVSENFAVPTELLVTKMDESGQPQG